MHGRGLRIGLLGGSFNPAHDGHRHLSVNALRMLGLDPEESERVVAAARHTLDKQNHLAA